MGLRLDSLEENHHFSQRIKLAFFDLDGTLINRAAQITSASLNALKQLREAGVAVAVATGRPYFGALDVVRTLKIEEASLFFSGSLIINPATDHIFHKAPLEKEALQAIANDAQGANLYTELYTENGFFVEKPNRQLEEMHFTYLQAYPIETSFKKLIKEAEILKGVVITSNAGEEKKLEGILARHTGLSIMVSKGASHPHIKFANITSPSASRENAFELFLKHYRVAPSEVAAFGDAEADEPFLSRAGYGVALDNAPAAVKEAAVFITRSVEEDGVAYAVERLLRGGALG